MANVQSKRGVSSLAIKSQSPQAPAPPYGVVWVACWCESQADTQSQQNKILISGTRGAFRSGNRSSVMMLAPRYWVAAVSLVLQ